MFDPQKMQQMMQQMGMDAEELDADRVTIEIGDKKLVFNSPDVTKLDVKGQETFQLMGEYTEEEKGPSQEDIELVADKADVDEDTARAALQKADDIADAVIKAKQA